MGKNKNYNYHAKEEIVEEIEDFDVKEEIVEKVVDDYVPQIVPGYVVGCNQLNMRFEPDPEAPVMNVLKRDQMVMVYLDEATDEWHHARTEYGVSGYVMKKYIELG